MGHMVTQKLIAVAMDLEPSESGLSHPQGLGRASPYPYDLGNIIIEWGAWFQKEIPEKRIQCFSWFLVACMIDSKCPSLVLKDLYSLSPNHPPPASSLATTSYSMLLLHWFFIIPYTVSAVICTCNIFPTPILSFYAQYYSCLML